MGPLTVFDHVAHEEGLALIRTLIEELPPRPGPLPVVENRQERRARERRERRR